MGKAKPYSKPKRSGESMIASVVFCIGAVVVGLIFFPTFMSRVSFLVHAAPITAHTDGKVHQVSGLFGQVNELDYVYSVDGHDYHGTAAVEVPADGAVYVQYDTANPGFSASGFREAYLEMAFMGGLILVAVTSGAGAMALLRRRE